MMDDVVAHWSQAVTPFPRIDLSLVCILAVCVTHLIRSGVMGLRGLFFSEDLFIYLGVRIL